MGPIHWLVRTARLISRGKLKFEKLTHSSQQNGLKPQQSPDSEGLIRISTKESTDQPLPGMTSSPSVEASPLPHSGLFPEQQHNDSQPPPDRQQSIHQPSPTSDMQAIPPRSPQEKDGSQVVSQLIDDKTLPSALQQSVENVPNFGDLSFDEKFKRTTEKPKYNDVQSPLTRLNIRFGLPFFSLLFSFLLR